MADLTIEDKLPPFYKPLKARSEIDELFETPAFEYSPKTSRAFLSAMRAALAFQGARSPVLKALYRSGGFSPASVKTERDIEKIPFLFVAALKERDLTTLAPSRIVLELKSSGTSGQRSRMQLDRGSLMRVRRMAWQVFYGLGLTDLERAHDYICFTYDPAVARDLGTAWTDKLLTGFTKKGEIFYTFRWSKAKNDFFFDLDGTVAALKRFEDSGSLVRLTGFPAFALKLTEEFKVRYGRYPRLNPGSSVATGGGWKTLADEAVDKKVYRRILADNLGIPAENVRDMFGMVEHGVPYMDCRLGHFHAPNYGRIIVRHPGTLEPLGFNKKGLLQFLTPYLTSYPSLSVLSSDFGLLRRGCVCGLPGPVLEIHGRAGVKKLKGCAISAATML
ncbi:MAG: acyl-protein synthetase [Elusimicrobiota bacterium]|nr:acyl-protein synthetase [Elusimicrobiota bacterium]